LEKKMALKDIREQIKAILAGVSGIGVVHEYERWAVHWDKFLDLYRDGNGRIHAWTITRVATPSKRDTMPTLQRMHKFRIRGIYALDDDGGSELVFQDLVEDIQDAFDDEYDLGGHVLNSGPVQVKIVETYRVGGVLCHVAELELEAWERKTYS